MADGRSAHGTGGAAAQGGQPTGALEWLVDVELPDCPAPRDEFFVRLLPHFDAAWESAARVDNVMEAAPASLLGLRSGVERAAERCLYPGRGPRRYVRFCTVALHIEMDAAVPESQVDCALAWAAEAARGAMSPIGAEGLTCSPAFFRYQDLMTVPLSAVHAALVTAATDGNPVAALRRMPFRAQSAAARCSPIYLRFLVGVALSKEGGDSALGGLCWSRLEQVVKAVLGVRLPVPVTVGAVCGESLYGVAHEGLRRYQAARLGRIVAGIDKRSDISALIDVRGTYPQQRMRLTLMRGRRSISASMLQMPLDESAERMQARIAAWLLQQGIARTVSMTTEDAINALSGSILAVPV